MAITHLSLVVTTITRGTRQIKALSGTLASLGSVALTVGLAAAGLTAIFGAMTFKSAIEKSMQLSDELQALKAATGATAEEFEKMKNLGFELGESMGAFTTPQAIESMRILAFAGFETNQILEATPQILKLSSAGMVDLATATDIVASAVRSFNLDAEDTTRVVDVLTKTFVSTNTMMDQLGEAMTYVNPVAAALGISIEEVATSLGILANSGIKSCYDKETEVLTKDGFKRWEEVTMNDVFATVNPETHSIEYQEPTQLFKYKHTGKMYSVKNRHIDLKVTPNHKMYVKLNGKDNYELIKAEDLYGREANYLCGGISWEGKEQEYITLHEKRSKYVGKKTHEKWEDYDDYVYCAEVPNHLLIVRRHGRIAVSGNSMAGTTMRAVLIRLVAPTTQAREALNDLNVELFEMGPTALKLNDVIKKQTDELRKLETQMISSKATTAELGMEMDKINLEESKNTLEIMKIRNQSKGNLDDLEKKMLSTKEVMSGLRFEMDKLSTSELQNSIEIMKIKTEAADKDKELSASEEKTIKRLEVANDYLKISQKELSVEIDRTNETLYEQEKQFDNLSSVGEAAIAKLELANDNLAISQQELSIEIDETNIKTAEQKLEFDNLTSAIDANNDALNGQMGDMKDLESILAEFKNKMEGMSAAEKAAALNAIFGRRAIAGFQVLINSVGETSKMTSGDIVEMNNALTELGATEEEISAATSDGIMTFSELKDMLEKSAGTADEMFKIMEEGTGKAWKQFTSAVDTVMIVIGDQFTPILINMTNVLKTILIPTLDSIMPTIQGIIDYLDQLGTAFMHLGKVVSDNKKLFGELLAIYLIFNPTFMQMVILIALLVASFVYVTEAIADFIEWLDKLGVLEDVSKFIDNLKVMVIGLWNIMQPFAKVVLAELVKAFDDVKVTLEQLNETFPWLGEFLGGVLLGMIGVIVVALFGLVLAFLGVVFVLAKVVEGIAWLVRAFLRFGSFVRDIILTVIDDLKDRWNAFIDVVIIVGDYLEWLDERFKISENFIRGMLIPIDLFIGGLNLLKDKIIEFGNTIKEYWEDKIVHAIDRANEFKNFLINALPTAIEEAKRFLMELVPQEVLDAVDLLVKKFGEFVDQIKYIIDKGQDLKDTMSGFELGGTGGKTVGDVGKGIGKVLATPFATGGIVNSPTLALIGEKGTEAVVPLDKPYGGIDSLGTTINTNDTINVNISVQGNVDENNRGKLVEEIIEKISEAKRNQFSSIRNRAVYG